MAGTGDTAGNTAGGYYSVINSDQCADKVFPTMDPPVNSRFLISPLQKKQADIINILPINDQAFNNMVGHQRPRRWPIEQNRHHYSTLMFQRPEGPESEYVPLNGYPGDCQSAAVRRLNRYQLRGLSRLTILPDNILFPVSSASKLRNALDHTNSFDET